MTHPTTPISRKGKTVKKISGNYHRYIFFLLSFSSFSAFLYCRIGFVTQDDVLFPQLTVEETLVFAAFLRLPARMSKQQKRDRVDAIITELNLERLLNQRCICLPDWHGIYYIFLFIITCLRLFEIEFNSHV